MIPNYERLSRMLEKDEGRGLLYFCPAGKLTFGVGRNLEARKEHFTQQELNHGKKHGVGGLVDICLLHDAEQAYRDVCDLFGWEIVGHWHSRRVHAVVNAVFCLGITRFRRFVKTVQYIKFNKWQDAAIELLDSKWHRDTPHRPERLAAEFRLDPNSEYGPC